MLKVSPIAISFIFVTNLPNLHRSAFARAYAAFRLLRKQNRMNCERKS